MNYFIFNNKNSLEDMNLGIVGNSTRPAIQEVIEVEEIEGRKQGSLVYKTGGYEDLIIKRKLRLLKFEDYNIETLKIMEWLTNIEDNRLIFKDYKEKCYKVKYVIVGTFEDYRGGNVDFEVTFRCEPFLYNTYESFVEISKGDLIFNDSNLVSEPLLKLTLSSVLGNVQVSIGSETIQLNDVKNDLEIDCTMQRVLSEGREVKTIGNFPILTPGYNIISWEGNVNSLKINKNSIYRG